jgi:hypothetical protein
VPFSPLKGEMPGRAEGVSRGQFASFPLRRTAATPLSHFVTSPPQGGRLEGGIEHIMNIR